LCCASSAAFVAEAILSLKSRVGCSQLAVEKYVLEHHGDVDYQRHQLRNAINKGLESGWLKRHHQHNNSCTRKRV